MRCSICCSLCLWLVVFASLGFSEETKPTLPDPWTDSSISVDKQQQLEILGEIASIAKEAFHRAWSRHQVGRSDQVELRKAAVDYYSAAAKLYWAAGAFEGSYCSAQFAVLSAAMVEREYERKVEQGVGSLVQLLAARTRRAELQLVLLRYQSLAEKHGIETEPASLEMMSVQESGLFDSGEEQAEGEPGKQVPSTVPRSTGEPTPIIPGPATQTAPGGFPSLPLPEREPAPREFPLPELPQE